MQDPLSQICLTCRVQTFMGTNSRPRSRNSPREEGVSWLRSRPIRKAREVKWSCAPIILSPSSPPLRLFEPASSSESFLRQIGPNPCGPGRLTPISRQFSLPSLPSLCQVCGTAGDDRRDGGGRRRDATSSENFHRIDTRRRQRDRLCARSRQRRAGRSIQWTITYVCKVGLARV